MSKILIVDDEDKIRELIRLNLELVGYECMDASNGEDAIELAKKEKFDLVLLDVMMAGKDGFETSKHFIDNNISVIFLTAKDNVLDKVKGLRLGAEDYITKPFENIELLARIETVLRRNNKISNQFEYKGVSVDFDKRTVKIDNNILDFTMQEYQLLETLIKNKNIAMSREKLLENAWGYDYYGDTRTVDMHIQRIRKKLNWDDIIVTVYKYGYRLEIK